MRINTIYNATVTGLSSSHITTELLGRKSRNFCLALKHTIKAQYYKRYRTTFWIQFTLIGKFDVLNIKSKTHMSKV